MQIFQYNNGDCLLKDVNLKDVGKADEESEVPEHLTHMKDYNFEGMKICNSHVALNSHFFCVGLVGEFKPKQSDDRKNANDKRSILGIYQFNSDDITCKIEQWINQYPFKNFFVDDNMTTVMFLSRSGRSLDYHFLLWDFDCDSLDRDQYRALMTIDAGHIPGYDDKEDGEDEVVDEEERRKVEEANSKTTCCTIF